MNFDMSSFQALAANLALEGEACDLAHAKLPTPMETDTDIAPLLEKIGAPSIAGIDALMVDMSCKRKRFFSNPRASEFSERRLAM